MVASGQGQVGLFAGARLPGRADVLNAAQQGRLHRNLAQGIFQILPLGKDPFQRRVFGRVDKTESTERVKPHDDALFRGKFCRIQTATQVSEKAFLEQIKALLHIGKERCGAFEHLIKAGKKGLLRLFEADSGKDSGQICLPGAHSPRINVTNTKHGIVRRGVWLVVHKCLQVVILFHDTGLLLVVQKTFQNSARSRIETGERSVYDRSPCKVKRLFMLETCALRLPYDCPTRQTPVPR